MGNDGGSIPKRRELVKEAARNPSSAEIKETQNEQQEYHWTTDPISHEALAQPVVSDSSGKLYNKATILEYLVEGSRKDDAESVTRGAVKSLKDVVEVKFAIDREAQTEANGNTRHEVWKCPVTGDTLGPRSKAVYIVPCGHAFSGSAIKEVSGEKCITCDTEYASNDIIPILPTSETDIARLSLRMKTLQEKGLTHSLKAAGSGKKRKKKEQQAEDTATATQKPNGALVKEVAALDDLPSSGSATPKGGSAINNSSTASIAAKVLQEQVQNKKRRVESENVRGLFSHHDSSKPSGMSGDFMTRGFSIPSAAKR